MQLTLDVMDERRPRKTRSGCVMPVAPYVPGSETSRRAAEKLTPTPKRLQVLRVLTECADATDNEIIAACVQRWGVSPNTPRARRVECWRAGWVECCAGERNGSALWRITALGRLVLKGLEQ